jgi:hypothetical protein
MSKQHVYCCHDSIAGNKVSTMRTTVTLEPDTESLLRGEVRRTGASFKDVLNQALRKALGPGSSKVRVEPVFPGAFPARLEGRSFNRLADEWDDETTIVELSS